MPKMKSKGAVKKRFKITKSGKARCSKPGRGHMHAAYSGDAGRSLRKPIILDQVWSTLIRRMMGV
jgi:large subunit ribosomal protein L35